jgi:hypothetical protein
VLVVLSLIGRLVLGEDLKRDLIKLTVRLRARVPGQPCPVDRDQSRLHQPRPITQLQNLGEQLRERRLVPNNEPRDSRVIRHHVAGDHPEGDVLTAVTLDRP